MAKSTYRAISRKLPAGLAVESESRGFKVIMDEPTSLGGTNTGMNPVEALLSSGRIASSAMGSAGNCPRVVMHVGLA